MSKKEVAAPLGGTVIELKVQVGDEVKTNDALFVLEAMKMENEICSEVNGVVSEITAKKGEVVEANKVVMVIEV